MKSITCGSCFHLSFKTLRCHYTSLSSHFQDPALRFHVFMFYPFYSLKKKNWPPSISASSCLVMSLSLSKYKINAPRKANLWLTKRQWSQNLQYVDKTFTAKVWECQKTEQYHLALLKPICPWAAREDPRPFYRLWRRFNGQGQLCHLTLACENIRFGEEGGETDVFAG